MMFGNPGPVKKKSIEDFLTTYYTNIFYFQMYQTLCKLPQICVKISMQGWWADGEGQQEKRPIHLPNPGMNLYSSIE
jgi:hypothetical protein